MLPSCYPCMLPTMIWTEVLCFGKGKKKITKAVVIDKTNKNHL